MADLNFTEIRRDLIPAGTWGNVQCQPGSYTFAAASINDVAALCKVPANVEVFAIFWNCADLGTSVTLDLGYRAEDGSPVDDDYFLAAEDVATAAASGVANGFTPYTTTEQTTITATIEGGAATGLLSVTVLYRVIGSN